VRILIWHDHGSWTNNFVQGGHDYLLPLVADRGPDGRGRAATWHWPSNVREVPVEQIGDEPFDVAIVQRPRHVELLTEWFGPFEHRNRRRMPPIVWLEHNAPQGRINEMRHPAADCAHVAAVVHVTHTNALLWDTGDVPTTVIQHGIVDPGHTWSGTDVASAVVVNEPVRRARVAGTDLLPRFGAVAPLNVYGMAVTPLDDLFGRPAWLRTHEDLPQPTMHERLGQQRCYVHPFRWTSLGLSLLEAMAIGMPVVALAMTEAPAAIGRRAGVVSNDVDELVRATKRLMHDRDWAAELGAAARSRVLCRYGLDEFLASWNRLLEVLCR
jgi:hypothetical protein